MLVYQRVSRWFGLIRFTCSELIKWNRIWQEWNRTCFRGDSPWHANTCFRGWFFHIVYMLLCYAPVVQIHEAKDMRSYHFYAPCWTYVYSDCRWLLLFLHNYVNFDGRNICLVGGLEHFWIFHILGIVIPTDEHIFQRGSNHQPD